MKRFRYLGLFIALAIIFSLLPAAVWAADSPTPPNRFYGTVTIWNGVTGDGSVSGLAPDGVIVSAWIGGVEKDTAVTLGGSYGATASGDHLDVFGNSADIVSFKVNGVDTGQTHAWVLGEIFRLDLTVIDSVLPTITLNAIPDMIIETLPAIGGTAADDFGLAKVQVAVNDLSNGKAWNGSSWVNGGDIWLDASGTTVWTYTMPALAGGNSYSVKAKAIDLAGNQSAVSSATFYTADDVPPPTPLLLSPANGHYTNNTTPTFDWSDVSDPAGVSYNIQIDNNADFSSPAVNAAGLLVSNYTSSVLPEGTYYWRVRAIDGALNIGDWSSVRSFIIDTVIPTVTIGALSPDPTNDNTPTFGGMAVDISSPVISVEYRINGGSWIAATAADGAFNSAVEEYSFTTAALADGIYTVEVRATDAAGNTTVAPYFASDTFTIDTGAPAVTINPLTPDPTNDNTPTFTGTATDTSSPIASVEYRVNGGSWIASAASDGAFNSTSEGYTFTTSALADGSYTVEVRATDVAGNTTVLANYVSDTFTIDTIAPSVTINPLSPDPTNDNTPTLIGTATDTSSPIALVEYRVNGGSWIAAAASDGAFNSTSEGYTFTVTALADGSYTVEVRATDVAGNTTVLANYASDTFTIDTGAPAVTINPLTPDPTNDNTPTLTGTATDTANPIASVEYRVNGGSWIAAAASDGAFNGTTEGYTFTTAALADGSYTVEVRGTDLAGNTTALLNYASDTFTIDTGAPAVIINPLTPDPTNDNTPTLTGTATDLASPIASVEYRVNGGSWIAATAADGAFNSTSEGYTFTAAALADGSYTVEVRATDIAGNTTVLANYASDAFRIDTIAPVISGIGAAGITSSSGYITWNTDELATTRVEYGTISGSYGFTASVPGLIIGHGINVSGLSQGVQYFYRVISVDEAGNEAVSAEKSFTTLGDIIPPVISDVTATGITTSSAVIGWNTNEGSTSQVEYGTTSTIHGSYTFSTALNPALVINHGASISGLLTNTKYYYRVISVDAFGNEAVSGEYSFTTLADTTPPVISGVTVTDITTSSGIVRWNTNEPASTQVEYGLDTSYGSTSALGSSLVFIHTVFISGLSPDTIYHYRVHSTDAAGNPVVSGDFAFETLADTTPPSISGVTAIDITTSDAWVLWNTSELSTSQVVYDTVSHPAGTYGSATEVRADYASASAEDTDLSIGHGIGLSGLVSNTTYYYRVLSSDAFGNYAWSSQYAFATLQDVSIPVISGVTVSDITMSDAWVLWNTDEPATSMVAYDTASHSADTYDSIGEVLEAYPLFTDEDTAMSIGHAIGLSGLDTYTTYYYRVISVDAIGNQSWSDEYSFTTLADTTPPVISDITSSGLTQTGANIYWNTDEPADSRVEYGTLSALHGGYTTLTGLNPSLIYIHGVALSGLLPSTTYFYRVISQDEALNEAVSGENSFTTPADTTPPVLSGIAATGMTDSSAIINWNTNEPATTRVEYGKTIYYGKLTALNSSLIFNHGVVLSGLSANTLYHYRVISVDAYGNSVTSADKTFTTLVDATPPVITEVTVTNISGTSAVINWLTNEKATTQVEYGLDTGYGLLSLLNVNLIPAHSVSLIGLTPGTEYHFRGLSRDATGNLGQSSDFTFTTVADITPPLLLTHDVVNITGSSATILWLTDEPSDSQVEYGLASAAHDGYDTTTILDTVPLTNHGVALGGLAGSTTYYYRIISKDGDGNELISDEYSFFTADTTLPDISLVSAVAVTSSGAVIVWITDENATTQVVFSSTSHAGDPAYANAAAAIIAYGSSSPEDGALLTSHGVVLSGRPSGTICYYRVVSRDAAGNETISAESSFTTS